MTNLDVSRCNAIITNTILQLLSQQSHATVEVLCIKNLDFIFDEGLVCVGTTCTELKTLDVSYCRNITNESTKAIGENLLKLEAFFARDNFCISDDGIQSIPLNCTKLKQLSLWGCLKLRKLYFDEEEEENVLDPSNEALSIKTIFGIVVI